MSRRPDPALGVLETILVRGGRPRRLERHLARLARSLDRLYGASPHPALRGELVLAAARLGRSGALRVWAGCDGRFELTGRPLERRPGPVRLEPVTLAGGLGAHKWADRRLLGTLAPGDATPLLLDGDGSVLEAAWGNVWISEGGRLLTPAADGRILPGVARDSMLRGDAGRRLHAAEARITLERLLAADAVLVSSSLAGVVPATVV